MADKEGEKPRHINSAQCSGTVNPQRGGYTALATAAAQVSTKDMPRLPTTKCPPGVSRQSRLRSVIVEEAGEDEGVMNGGSNGPKKE